MQNFLLQRFPKKLYEKYIFSKFKSQFYLIVWSNLTSQLDPIA